MTWNGKNIIVKLINKTYKTGIKLTKKAIAQIENQIQRLTNSHHEIFPILGNWFIDI